MEVSTLILAWLLAFILGVLVGKAKRVPAGKAVATLPTADSVQFLMRSRRSVFPKDYSGSALPRNIVLRALEAANWAPTHGKTEPWRWVVFEGPTAIARLLALKRDGISMMLEGDARVAALAKASKKEKELLKCSHIVAICCKRVPNAKGTLMPEWEEMAAVACAVQNLHLALHAEGGGVGYWSSGGVDGGWADAPAVREFLGMDGYQGQSGWARDKVLGWFHIGRAAPETVANYKARRGPIDGKVTWVTE
eukprot:CAMPEP_0119304500 /NCGR_PEP_ID=MMETSP1333-20130426/5717_1 /TAXON_ID=418940 /ORGANISM="Scyphosphaera apsteinii, Strain RCC1455" /LENGTH=250 /DNA_ID=CAMNT_0007307399 /DNA_START=107 /DNA_END=859 /DNA_ORIENTATION=-